MFYDKKTVLVTGGHGFVGQNLVAELKKRGVFTIVSTHQECDLTRQQQTQNMYERYKPNIVIHLAGNVGGIRANQENPAGFFYDNIMMGINIIEYAPLNTEKIVMIGTTCSYPKYLPEGFTSFDEKQLWNGHPEETNAPYGIAKRALLTMTQAYRQQYDMNIIYLIPANLYGPWDDFDLETSHVIPALIRKFHEAKINKKESVTLWGSGNPTREFLYIGDVVEGILLATENYNKPEPVNLGTGKSVTIRNLAYSISDLIEYKGKIIWDNKNPDGQPRRRLDCSRAYKEFGFKAKVSLETGLRKTIRWYQSRSSSL